MPHAESDEDKLRCSSCNSDDQEEQDITPAVPRKQNAHCHNRNGSKPAPDCASVGGDDRCGQRSESRKLDGELHSYRSPPAGRTVVGWGCVSGTMVGFRFLPCIVRVHRSIVSGGSRPILRMSGSRPFNGLVSGCVYLYARFRQCNKTPAREQET